MSKKTAQTRQEIRQFTKNGITLVYFRNSPADLFKYLVKGDKELTELIMSNVNNKMIGEEEVECHQTETFFRIENDMFVKFDKTNHPTIKLNTMCQKLFKKHISFSKHEVIGEGRKALIKIKVVIPEIAEVEGQGISYKMAKVSASINALKQFN